MEFLDLPFFGTELGHFVVGFATIFTIVLVLCAWMWLDVRYNTEKWIGTSIVICMIAFSIYKASTWAGELIVNNTRTVINAPSKTTTK